MTSSLALDAARAGSGEERNAIHLGQRLRRTFAQRLDQLDHGHLAFAVDDHIKQAGRQRLRRHVSEKAAAGNHFGPASPGQPRQAQPFDATDRFLADAHIGRAPPLDFRGERAPAHFQRRRVQDFDAQVPQPLAQHRRQGGKRQRRPEGARWAVERPEGPRGADKEEQLVHGWRRGRASRRNSRNTPSSPRLTSLTTSATSASAPQKAKPDKAYAAKAPPSIAVVGRRTSMAPRMTK